MGCRASLYFYVPAHRIIDKASDMPITQELCDNGRILYAALSDPWDIPDLIPYMAEARRYFLSAECRIHVLINVSGTSKIPSMSLLLLRNHLSLDYPNHGHIAVVGASAAIRSVANVLFSIARFKRVKFFNAEYEAWDYLRKLVLKEPVGIL
jgi:hypothetical protein